MKSKYFEKTLIAGLLMTSASAFAVPLLQIGAGGTGDGGPATDPNWAYAGGTPDTWVNSGDGVFNVDLTAQSGAFYTSSQTAYLVIAALPQQNSATDVFNISLLGDVNTSFSLFSSGFGKPPITDSNDLQPHSIYDTYFEIYSFEFNNAQTTIFNTTPGDTGSTSGFLESVNVTINSLSQGITGIHLDLFTLYDDPGNGPRATVTADQVYTNAPYSHDAEWSGTLNPPDPDPDPNPVPEPTALWMLGLGLLGLAGFKRKQAKLAA
ncbi:MAG: choice-of-anchor N protein [Methylococcales bacterium]|nr:choice-of-anchor N protein [Methylococcales bacterium]